MFFGLESASQNRRHQISPDPVRKDGLQEYFQLRFLETLSSWFWVCLQTFLCLRSLYR